MLESLVRKGQQMKVKGRSRRKSGLTVEPSRRCGRWRDCFQELGSMVNSRSLRIHPDELFEPFSAKSKSTETAKRQGYAIFKLSSTKSLPAASALNAAPPHAFLISAAHPARPTSAARSVIAGF